MKGVGKLVLVSGLLSAGMGVLLLAVGRGIDGLVWFAVPILLLGLVLLGMYARDALRPAPPPDTPETVAANLPGKWYPFALLGIVVVQVVWLVVWSKL